MHCRLFARDTIPLTPFAPRTHSIAAPQHLQPHLFLHTQPLQHLRRHQTAGFCSLMRSSFVVLICRLRKQQTAHFVTRYELYQGVLYFQHVTVLHGTRVNVILRMSQKKIKAFFSRLFTKLTNSQHCPRPSDEFFTIYVALLWFEIGQR